MSDRSYMNDTDVGNGANTMGMFLMGALVGAGVALLLAPATGGDARKKVGEVARKLGSRASDLVSRASEEASGTEGFGGGGSGEPYRSGGRREPMNARPATPGTQGTTS